MGIVNDLVKDIPIPRMIRVKQCFDNARITDINSCIHDLIASEEIINSIKPGMHIALTAGSRGITDIANIIKAVAENLRDMGTVPFVIPAMGSHGGATAQGQLEVLSSYNITEEYVGCPIYSSMEVKKIGETSEGRPVQIDRYAAEADGIVIINRIKPHTSFTGSFESGLMKMLAIGLANQAGAEVCHQEGYAKMAENIKVYGQAILDSANILFGIAIVENAYDEPCEIEAIPGYKIPIREPELLKHAKVLMPKILFNKLDVLVVDRMGKNISGLGMDPHITGCFASSYANGPPRPDKLVVLDLTKETHGNGTGIGVADITTKRLFEAFDMEKSYPNVITATLTQAVKIPLVMENQKLAIQTAIKTASGFNKKDIRMVRISDTLHISEIFISEALVDEAQANPKIKILMPPEEMNFNEMGNIF